MKKILLILICLISLYSSEIKLNLLDFANLASKNSNVDILISDDINVNDFYFYTSNASNIKISHFRKAIESKNLKLVLTDNFYYVFSNSKELNKKLRMLKLNNNSFDDIQKIINLTTDNNSTYINSNNSIVFNSDDEKYNEIIEFSQLADIKAEQVSFKLTITETNINNIRNLGTQLNSLLKVVDRQDLNLFFNIITMPFSLETNVISSKKNNFYSVMSFLEENNFINIKQSPYLTAKNQTEVYFSSVENIPYLIQNQQIKDNRQSVQNSYDYKDVGLKIKIKPVILKDYVDLNLDLIFEDVLESSITPKISKKELKSSYLIKKGEVLVLSGINKEISYKKRNGIPFLKDVPIIKYLFSINQNYLSKSVITLTIEVN